MTFDRSAPTDPKYRSREHRELRGHYVRRIRNGEPLDCTADECLFGTPITNANGNDDDGLHLGHNADGVTYAGPQHRACNVKDGARRGRARQDVTQLQW